MFGNVWLPNGASNMNMNLDLNGAGAGTDGSGADTGSGSASQTQSPLGQQQSSFGTAGNVFLGAATPRF